MNPTFGPDDDDEDEEEEFETMRVKSRKKSSKWDRATAKG